MVDYHQLIFIFLISNLALWNIYPEKSEKTLLSIMWESVYEDKGILKEPLPLPRSALFNWKCSTKPLPPINS